jgi:translation initiation factor IF-2
MSNDGHQKIELPTSITVRDLAQRIDTSPIEIIKILMSNGVMANINQQIDFDTAAVVASELGFEASVEAQDSLDEEKEIGEIPLWRQIISREDPSKLVNRPPVVTILGHVDHGKTTLLDAIRHTDVATGEAGGITQHIGAYQIDHNGRLITFLDTPGHAAFTAMRSRGAQGADIVVLVVAANDGVMPQTREAIAHAKAAQVPIVVALNKVDLEDANTEYVKNQLAESGLVPDEWEGDTIIVPVSAKNQEGLDDLMEAILLVADSSEICANPDGEFLGTVIESHLDKSKGVLANLLIQNGTLKQSDVFTAGATSGKIKVMYDHRGKKVRKAGPSSAVMVMGLNDVPEAGNIVQVHSSEKIARNMAADYRIQVQKDKAPEVKSSLEELFSRYQAGEVKELRLVIKADVQGSLEPIISSLDEIEQTEIKISILLSGTGNISENDITLAQVSNAIVIGFNVQTDPAAQRLADDKGVSIRNYNIIYRLTEHVEKALKGMLTPVYEEVVSGRAEVLAVFRISKQGNIAGCRVTNGKILHSGTMRVIRDDSVIHEGNISSLKREKDDVKEVRNGFECGIAVKNFTDFVIGDTLECFTSELANT